MEVETRACLFLPWGKPVAFFCTSNKPQQRPLHKGGRARRVSPGREGVHSWGRAYTWGWSSEEWGLWGKGRKGQRDVGKELGTREPPGLSAD